MLWFYQRRASDVQEYPEKMLDFKSNATIWLMIFWCENENFEMKFEIYKRFLQKCFALNFSLQLTNKDSSNRVK